MPARQDPSPRLTAEAAEALVHTARTADREAVWRTARAIGSMAKAAGEMVNVCEVLRDALQGCEAELLEAVNPSRGPRGDEPEQERSGHG